MDGLWFSTEPTAALLGAASVNIMNAIDWGSMSRVLPAFAEEGAPRPAMQALRIGLPRAAFVRADGGARTDARAMDVGAGADRDLDGLGKGRAGQQGQEACRRKDSTDYHFNAPS